MFSASTSTSQELGPLLGDGTHHCEIAIVERDILVDHFGHPSSRRLNVTPESLKGHTHWQHGIGKHTGPDRRILGYNVLTATSYNGNHVRITHRVLDGSSQMFIGRNVTSRGNIEHIDCSAVLFMVDGQRESISIIDEKILSYIKLDRFDLWCNFGSTFHAFLP